MVKNFQGQPSAGQTVTWTIVSGAGTLLNGNSTVTDANGQTTNQFLGNSLFGVNFSQAVITASISTSSVNFTQTTSGVDPNAANAPYVQTQVDFPALGDVISGASGSTGTSPIKVRVFAVGAAGFSAVPNALIKLIPADANGPQITCSGNSGYTDFNGNANCLPLFTGTPGSGRYTIDVGGNYRVFGPYQFTVTQGQLSLFRITGGNNQSGAPGSRLPLTLTARAEDSAGNGQANVPVVWEAVIPGTATISNAGTTTDASGNVSATVTLGQAAGNVQVRLRNATGTVQTLFTFQVAQPVTGLSKAAGDSQDAITNTNFAQPLIVLVTGAQGPIAGAQVQFVSNGVVSFPNGPSAVTDSQGRASTVVRAGSTPGAAIVTASVPSFSVSFNLTVRLPGPQITSSSFTNFAGGQPGGVSPAGILAISGRGIATGIQGCVNGPQQMFGPLPLQVANVNVEFVAASFRQFAPIFSVCNVGGTQEYVVIQVPAELPLGATSITVRAGSGSTTLDNIPVFQVSPGVFEGASTDGKNRAVLQRVSDGSFITLENPARKGDRLRAFVSGLGRPVSKTGVRLGSNQGGIPNDDASPQVNIIVGVADQGVNFVSAIYASDVIGVYLVTFDVPSNAPSGDVTFSIAAILNENPTYSNPSMFRVQ
ncbi:MAG TPA: hypothetical protein VL285_10325 [Bryobacteraceae bacterium]|nr:hypothetical protein [Bryobacteraceae bacterium]